MKKIISVILSVLMIFASCAIVSSAADISYDQPFAAGTENSETYRIPAIITLNDGSVMAAADKRYAHGSDAPNNLDTLVAVSADGYTGWSYADVNNFNDYASGYSDANSASFIDSALVQSSATGRIFIVCDAFPSGIGYAQSQKGSGYVTVNGVKYLALTTGKEDSFSDFTYYIGSFAGGFAPVTGIDGTATAYTVDTEYNLYKDGAPLYTAQAGSDEQVMQNVFFTSSELHVYKTSYLWLRYSDDNGQTWSAPEILNGQVKSESDAFYGVGPGKGFVTEVNGSERIIFLAYSGNNYVENVSAIYSDDNGQTWQKGESTSHTLIVGKTSEAQIVALPDGTLRMFARNNSNYVSYADSKDRGVTWSRFTADLNLRSNGNCMVSFINYSGKINGKSVIIGSFASNTSSRKAGIVVVGLVNDDNSINWTTTYHVDDASFFAYSCLTELADGNIGYLYEDEAAHIEYKVLTIATDGTLSEINGQNGEIDTSFGKKFKDFFVKLFAPLIRFFSSLSLI